MSADADDKTLGDASTEGRFDTTRHSVRIGPALDARLSAAVDAGAYPNRSAAIRDGLDTVLPEVEHDA